MDSRGFATFMPEHSIHGQRPQVSRAAHKKSTETHTFYLTKHTKHVRELRMDTYTAVEIAEGQREATTEAYIAAWQHLIDTGVCWQLQGFFGREAHRLIQEGYCRPPR